ncbi:ABC transporter permease [Gordonia sp. SL306]|uniref:ABC transporter permease n=1 Tax=Gordonia sp. SL306 TaxID=2995145 RepID=UPI00227098F7|nr:ABC transporter permease [Gordonia sp. SL306]WAC57544.1 ABC transporter permease [Gordonia sp. SL306]
MLGRVLGPAAVFVAVLGLWSLVSYVILPEQRRFLVPPPGDVFAAALTGPEAAHMWSALGRTTVVALVGLAIAFVVGVGWAVVMSQARWIENSLFPYAVVLQCIPILAVVPVVGFWFGFGFVSRVLVCVLIALFPIVSNTLFGLRSVDVGHRDLFALHCTSRWVRLRKLEIPSALPGLFAGLRISAGLSVVGAVVGDFFYKQNSPGIGILMDTYRARRESAELFAAASLASLLGVSVFVVFGWIGQRVVGRWSRA